MAWVSCKLRVAPVATFVDGKPVLLDSASQRARRIRPPQRPNACPHRTVLSPGPAQADGSPYIHAAARRELGMLECLWRLGCPLRTRPVLREAVRAGAPLEALQWLFGHGLTATDSELRDELEFVGGEMARWTWRDSGRAVRSFLEERLAAVQGGA